MITFVAVARSAELADETAIHVEIEGVPVCLARSQGQVYALYDVCSHADVALSEGEVAEGAVECWLHGSRFDLATGEPTGLPATQSVPTYPVRIEDGDIFVAVQES